jgi:diguanylate cyclase (GGDEF)-like protein/PAS domain S-box-containing protein
MSTPATRKAPWRMGPIFRISVGVSSLVVTLVLVADALLGIVPKPADNAMQLRYRTGNLLASQMALLLSHGDEALLGKSIQQMLARNPEIRTIAIKREDGSLLLRRGNAVAGVSDQPLPDDQPMRVQIKSGSTPTGEIEIRFTPPPPWNLRTQVNQPMFQLVLILGVGGFALSYLYLRRALQYLNPSSTVPDRVRKAFDSLSVGLLILDQESRIVLANEAFRRLHPQADGELHGQRLAALEWLAGSLDKKMPWQDVIKTGQASEATPLTVQRPQGGSVDLLLNCAPITDPRGRARGCLLTFDDVTAVHQANDELRATLGELRQSRELIEAQNKELRRLASRDPMTGCYNRRAFFEQVTEAFDAAKAQHTTLCCIMADIDHFKQFNDLYGHAIGDQVIQSVSRALNAGLRQADVLCRYGGEEFCIILPLTSVDDAMAVAERIRVDIETNAHTAVRSIDLPRITSSFGLATITQGASTFEELIDHADQALYASKQGGRNRVTLWTRPVE